MHGNIFLLPNGNDPIVPRMAVTAKTALTKIL